MAKKTDIPIDFFPAVAAARPLLDRAGWTPANGAKVRICGALGRTRTAQLIDRDGYVLAQRTISAAEARALATAL